MMLRWLVTQLLRHTSEQKIRAAVSDILQQRANRSGGEPNADEAADAPPLPPCQVAVIYATNIESEGFTRLFENRVTTKCSRFVEHIGMLESHSIAVADSGVGMAAATAATDDMISMHKPAWVLSAGFATGLRDGMKRGHVLMADHVSDTGGNELTVGFQMDDSAIESTPGLHVGRLLTVDNIVRDPKEKRSLADQHDAAACDMETMAVADVCRREKVRFMAVRVITDTVDDRLPQEIERLVDQQTTAAKLGAATAAIFNRPSSVKDLWRLRDDAQKASDRLAKFLAGVIPQLPVE